MLEIISKYSEPSTLDAHNATSESIQWKAFSSVCRARGDSEKPYVSGYRQLHHKGYKPMEVEGNENSFKLWMGIQKKIEKSLESLRIDSFACMPVVSSEEEEWTDTAAVAPPKIGARRIRVRSIKRIMPAGLPGELDQDDEI